jgi:hypothetical protein
MQMKPFPLTLCLALLLGGILQMPTASAQQSVATVTVAFQGTGTAVAGSKQIPFGFSIRCYDVRCFGALSFGASAQYVTGTLKALQPEMFLISVTNSTTAIPFSGSSSCSLVNNPPITQGQTNKVTVTCATPAFTATSDNATVLVSAPGAE